MNDSKQNYFGENWMRKGLLFGIWMFFFMQIFNYFFLKNELTWGSVLFNFIWWMAFGLLYGWITMKFRKRRHDKNKFQ